tara:strand:+ start:423 stop:527 length:105 start_codon:yes stop_codon:yes gene_type:complete
MDDPEIPVKVEDGESKKTPKASPKKQGGFLNLNW